MNDIWSSYLFYAALALGLWALVCAVMFAISPTLRREFLNDWHGR